MKRNINLTFWRYLLLAVKIEKKPIQKKIYIAKINGSCALHLNFITYVAGIQSMLVPN